jgi:hypothetical protein
MGFLTPTELKMTLEGNSKSQKLLRVTWKASGRMTAAQD